MSNRKIDRFINAMTTGTPPKDEKTKDDPSGVDFEDVLNPEKGEVPEETAERLKINPELLEALNRERLKNAGRPKDGERPSQEAGTKEGETRATFIVNKTLLKKVKYISVMETKLHKEIVNEALAKYVDEWEAENGKIQIKK